MSRQNRFQGKSALITGGARGIGLATAVKIAREGGQVAISDIRPEFFEEAQAAIEKAGSNSIVIQGDATQPDDVQKMVDQTMEAYGRLDILVPCAGVGNGSGIEKIDEETWDKVMELDMKSVYLNCHAAIPAIRNSGGGAIVNIASIGGVAGNWGGAFGAAKAGIILMTKSMAFSHAKENIRVNCVSPGVIDTPLVQSWLAKQEVRDKVSARHPMGRVGNAEEVAAAICFLASDEASYITGVNLPVDGGYLAVGM